MVNINSIIKNVVDYAQDNMVVAISAAIILLFLLIKRPWVFMVLVILVLAAYGVMLIFEKLYSLGLAK